MITIIDYGLGNLASVKNMIKKVGGQSQISADPAIIAEAKKLILPGVGAFGQGMNNLHDRGLVAPIKECVKTGVPLLGICLGAQLLTHSSDEAEIPGLGLVNAKTLKFDLDTRKHKVPHMGWNNIKVENDHSRLLKGFEIDPRFYFVHSYFMQCESEENVLCTADYGGDFCAGVINNNVMGVQFHPEKSHVFGMNLMNNYVNDF